MPTTLQNKLLADHYGRLGDELAAAGNHPEARAAYTQQAQHHARRLAPAQPPALAILLAAGLRGF